MLTVRIKNQSHHPLPEYHSTQAAGFDVRANLDGPIILKPLERALISTGLYLALPEGYEAQVRPRSGLAIKHGIGLINAPGTIDSDYRGEVGILLVNLSNDEYVVQDGDRIAQIVVAKHERVGWELTDDLDATVRGEGGFGHTGRS